MNDKPMKRYAIHVNWAGSSFVKDYDYYVSQGGLKERWGRAWTIVRADSYEACRLFAMQHMGARTDGLFCPICGGGMVHNTCMPIPKVAVLIAAGSQRLDTSV